MFSLKNFPLIWNTEVSQNNISSHPKIDIYILICSIIALQCVSFCCTTAWIGISIHISPPSWASLPPHPDLTLIVITEHWTELPVLHHGFPPPIDFAHGSVCMSVMRDSQFVAPSPSPHCVCKFVLYSCSANRIISTIDFSRFYIYVLTYDPCFFLPDLLHPVWQTLGSPTSLQMTQFHSFLLRPSNIPFYICTTYILICSSVDRHLGCFHILAIVNLYSC